jgi:glyoxylase-like metal-dependent hydrolase (beta-lactamase superfamily II)
LKELNWLGIWEAGLLVSFKRHVDQRTLSYVAESGSIGDYRDSLVRLRCFGLRALYPGHGKISTTPIKDIDQQSLTHRKFLTNRAPRVPRYSFKSCGRMTVTRTVNSSPEVVTRINL